eukprot:214816_1
MSNVYKKVPTSLRYWQCTSCDLLNPLFDSRCMACFRLQQFNDKTKFQLITLWIVLSLKQKTISSLINDLSNKLLYGYISCIRIAIPFEIKELCGYFFNGNLVSNICGIDEFIDLHPKLDQIQQREIIQLIFNALCPGINNQRLILSLTQLIDALSREKNPYFENFEFEFENNCALFHFYRSVLLSMIRVCHCYNALSDSNEMDIYNKRIIELSLTYHQFEYEEDCLESTDKCELLYELICQHDEYYKLYKAVREGNNYDQIFVDWNKGYLFLLKDRKFDIMAVRKLLSHAIYPKYVLNQNSTMKILLFLYDRLCHARPRSDERSGTFALIVGWVIQEIKFIILDKENGVMIDKDIYNILSCIAPKILLLTKQHSGMRFNRHSVEHVIDKSIKMVYSI